MDLMQRSTEEAKINSITQSDKLCFPISVLSFKGLHLSAFLFSFLWEWEYPERLSETVISGGLTFRWYNGDGSHCSRLYMHATTHRGLDIKSDVNTSTNDVTYLHYYCNSIPACIKPNVCLSWLFRSLSWVWILRKWSWRCCFSFKKGLVGNRQPDLEWWACRCAGLNGHEPGLVCVGVYERDNIFYETLNGTVR